MAAWPKNPASVSGARKISRGHRFLPGFLTFCLAVPLGLPVSPFPRQADAAEGQLVVAGSGTNLPVIWLLSQAFHRAQPLQKIYIPTSIGSSGAVRAVARGAVDIGLISRDLTDEEKSLEVTVVPYARTAVIMAVNSEVTEEDISFDEINGVYLGAKGRWKNGKKIIVLTREPGESTIMTLEKKIPGFREAYDKSQRAQRWKTLLSDQEMNQALVATPNAFGFSDLGAIKAGKLPIKALRVNGVAPTPDNIRNGSYPLVKTLSFVYVKGHLPPTGQAFLEFVGGEQGQKILKAYGYLPVRMAIGGKPR
jgi:phosphate transport system substrate-binding protein